MGLMKVVGIQKLDYVSRKTGKPVKGCTYYCTLEDRKVDGVATRDFYIAGEPLCEVGDIVEPYYNEWRRVIDLVIKENEE